MAVDPDGIDDELVSDVEVGPGQIVDAGPDPRRPHSVRQGLRLRREARRKFGLAIRQNINQPESSRTTIREAIRVAASATYWLEGTPELTDAHYDIHLMGRWANEFHNEDCALTWTGSRYEHRCPVYAAHRRFGMSAAMLVRTKNCSLCGQAVEECAHLPTHLYRVRGGPSTSALGRCAVCLEEACDHSSDQTYLVTPVGVIKDIISVEEISFVSRPKSPDARIIGFPIDEEALAQHLGPGFQPGVHVNCDDCQKSCSGFYYLHDPADGREGDGGRTAS